MAEEDEEQVDISEEEGSLPFPNARVVKLMREVLDPGKIIKKRVKVEMNKWLGEMCKRVTREMNKSKYTVIEIGDFRRAINKYEQLELVEKQKERIIANLLKIKQDCDFLIGEIERSFVTE